MYEYVCVLISDCVHCLHPWLSDFAHYPLLLFLCSKAAGTILFLVFSTSSFPPSHSFLIPPLLFFQQIHYISHTTASLSLSFTHKRHHVASCVPNTNVCTRWQKTQVELKHFKKKQEHSRAPYVD